MMAEKDVCDPYVGGSLYIQLKIPHFFSLKSKVKWNFQTYFKFLNEIMEFKVSCFNTSWIEVKLKREIQTNISQAIKVNKVGIKRNDGTLYKIYMQKKNFSLHPLMRISYAKLFADEKAFHPNSDVIFFIEISDGGNHCVDISSQASPTITCQAIDPLVTLSNDFGKFYDNKTFSDCVIKCGDLRFPVHRHVLSARSEVFEAMFHHDTSESQTGEIDIPDIEAPILKHVLHYIYRGEIRGLGEDTASSMYVAADKYALLELKGECLRYLENNLTVKNIGDAITLAHIHGEELLNETVIQFLDDNLKKIIESDAWNKLLSDKPLLANKVLSAAYLKSKES